MRRAILLGLMALALPMAAFADSVTVIPVNNPSFETLPPGGLNQSCGPGCHFSSAAIPGWTGGDGQVVPSVTGHDRIFDQFAPQNGHTSAYSNGGTISQTVEATVQAGVIYSLSLEIGRRNDTSFAGSADLLVGGEKFMATGNVPRPGHWSTFTASFTGSAANAGDPITIQLNASGVQGNFDSVKLTATTPSTVIPEPGTLGLLGTGLIGLAGMARRKLKLWM